MHIIDWDQVEMFNPAIGRQKLGLAGNSGVTQLIAGSNITLSPSAGTGAVTISSTGGGGGIPDAPSDGSTYGRKNAAWVTVGGSVSTGNLTESTSSILTITGGTNAVVGSGTTIQVKQASGSQSGYLSSSDWTTFNGKQAALTLGNFTETTSSVLTISGGSAAVIGSGITVAVKQSSASQAGYLSSSDWTTFNNKLSDAPSDGTTYGRKNGAWSAVSGGIPDAPSDSAYYVRQNAAWVAILPASPGGNFGWWKFDEGSGTTTADSSGNGLTLTLTNSPTWTTGPTGNGALKFDGSTNYVASASTNWSSATITISCWVSCPWNTQKYRPLFAMNYGSTTGIALLTTGGASQDWQGKDLIVVSNGFTAGRNPRGVCVYPGSTDLSWHHIVATMSPTLTQIWWDTIPLSMVVSAAGNVPNITSQPIQIGANTGTSDFSDATQDDTRVFNRILTYQEIQALFFEGAK